MDRYKYAGLCCVFLVSFLGTHNIVYSNVHIAGNSRIVNARLGGSAAATDPCNGLAIGQAAAGGAICAGSWNGSNYMTTPGNCTDYVNNATAFTPVCNGASDTVTHAWANNSGTTAYNVVTGIASTTDGSANTTSLLGYTDTDAARYCHYMNYGGYTDWYLPAASLANDANGELKNVLYTNKAALGGFQASFYWSSTENFASSARIVFFLNGGQASLGKTDTVRYVRCVRRY